MADRDYSHVPLWRKLGAFDGTRVAALHVPAAVRALPDFPKASARLGREMDVVISFATESAALDTEFSTLVAATTERGGVWVAFPKKTSPLLRDLDFNAVQRIGLSSGLVDNKTCRIDDDWQAMRFVRRRT